MSRIKYLGDLNYRTNLPKEANLGDVYWVKSMKHYYIYDGEWDIIDEDKD